MTRFLVPLVAFVVAVPMPARSALVLHHAVTPVGVPGGTTSFYMDDQDPPDLQPPVVESLVVAADVTASFPTFTSVPFTADTALPPFFSVSVFLSADQMTDCVDFSQTLAQVDTGGAATTIGSGTLEGLTVPMSPDAGLSGFQDLGVLAPVAGSGTVHAGEGVALTIGVTNHCGADRTVWLSYDSLDAESFLRFLTTNEVEFLCQSKTAVAAGGFLGAKEKCLIACQRHALSGSEPASDCVPPYAGDTASCVLRAEGRFVARESACLDCPECYSGGDCPADAAARVPGLEGIVDTLEPSVFCDDSGSGDGLTATESKCQQKTAYYLGKLASGTLKCLAACRKKEFKGVIPSGSCTPPVSDPRTITCLSKIETRTATSIDGTCLADPPECYTTGGAGWVDLVRTPVQGLDGGLFCGSPSGAFVGESR